MEQQAWKVFGEVEAGGVWAAVVEHPSVDHIDRTHCETRMSLGLWMSPHDNASQGCFLTDEWKGGHVPLGAIVAIPGGIPLHVRSAASPERRMLHCRLPATVPFPTETMPLATCMDLRNKAVAQGLLRMAREVVVPGFGTDAIIEGLGLIIAGELKRSSVVGPQTRCKGGLAPWQIRRIDDYLRAGHWNSSVSDLASLCGVSPSHTMRAFRQSTGRSIADHIAVLRMSHARTLLAQGVLSVAEIAAHLRFASPSAFAVAFRRSIGISPNEYRQRQRARD